MAKRVLFWSALCVWVGVSSFGPALAAERFERDVTHEQPLVQGAKLNVENLIGSLTVRGDNTGGKVMVEAHVVTEAESWAEAKAINEMVEIATDTTDGVISVRVVYPVDRYSSFKMPRSEKSGLMSKWVTPLVRKNTVAAVYGGRTVEIGQGRGALPVAVYLKVTIPMDVEAVFKQIVGTTHAIGVRGNITLEAIEGQLLAEQVYGTLQARTGGGEVVVRKFNGEAFHTHTGSGSLTLMEVKADQAKVLSGSGAVEGGITASSLEVETSTGDVRLEVDSVDIKVNTGSGAVDLSALITRTREASINTSTGDVTLRVSRATPFGLHAQATSGSVKHRDMSAEVLELEKNSVRLQRGEGGADLRVTTDKGEVLVRPL